MLVGLALAVAATAAWWLVFPEWLEEHVTHTSGQNRDALWIILTWATSASIVSGVFYLAIRNAVASVFAGFVLPPLMWIGFTLVALLFFWEAH
jgi:hypothetical protein